MTKQKQTNNQQVIEDDNQSIMSLHSSEAPADISKIREKYRILNPCYDEIVKDLITTSLTRFAEKIKVKMDEEADFCRKGDIIPSIHPRRVKNIIDKLLEEEFKEVGEK